MTDGSTPCHIVPQQSHCEVAFSLCEAGAVQLQVLIGGCSHVFLAFILGLIQSRGHCVCGRFVGGARGNDEYEDL